MTKIMGSRGIGKTYELLRIANEEGAIVGCNNVNALREMAKQHGFENVEILPYHMLFANGYNNRSKNVYIDEVEGYLRAAVIGIKGYSMSME